MNIILGNWGNPTIAVLTYCHQHRIAPLIIATIDTGWGSDDFKTRRDEASNYAQSLGIEVVQLTAPWTFSEMVKERGQFPSVQHAWCAPLLKGAVYDYWLSEVDPDARATVILGTQRAMSRALFDLPEYIESSEHHGGRRVWYPLYDATLEQQKNLVQASRLEYLSHPSLECSPCIYNTKHTNAALSIHDRNRLNSLEKQVRKPMFALTQHTDKTTIKNTLIDESYTQGCGSPWACGS